MSPPAGRLPAIDWMRGVVMVLMAVDHASSSFNAGKLVADSAYWGAAGAGLPAAQFLTRWITHLCAPTFLFLAGTALALSVERRLGRGEDPREVDGHLVRRGLLIVALELWMMPAMQSLLLQVLYAIGAAMICMVVLRRLPSSLLLALALGWLAASEAIVGAVGLEPPTPPGVVAGLLAAPHVTVLGSAGWLPPYFDPFFIIGYPLLPWLSMMVLGWVFGRHLLRRRREGLGGPERLLAALGLAGLALFALVRGLDGYGNFGLPLGEDPPPLRWLQTSKYPPSIAFTACELGIMALLLAAFFRWTRGREDRVRAGNPLLVFGQTALFFYVLHAHLLLVAAYLIHGEQHVAGLGQTYAAALGALVVLYPACLWFRRYKAARPGGWARYF